MLITAHALTGAFIGKEVGYPPLAFLLGLLSHFALDVIPHCDGPDDKPGKSNGMPKSTGQYFFVLADVIVLAILFGFLNKQHEVTYGFVWGAVGGIFPDCIDNVPFWSHQLRKLPRIKQFHQFHSMIQRIKTPLWFGFLIQYSIMAIFFYLLLRSSH